MILVSRGEVMVILVSRALVILVSRAQLILVSRALVMVGRGTRNSKFAARTGCSDCSCHYPLCMQHKALYN